MLASLTELRDYRVQATDGDLGRIADLGFRQNEWIARYVVVDDETWSMPYLVVGAPSGAERSLIATDYVQTIDLGTRNIYLSLPADAVAHSPVLIASEPVTPELEQSLREYYDRYSR